MTSAPRPPSADPGSGSGPEARASAVTPFGLDSDAGSRWRRGRITAEIAIVLSLSLGASAVYSVVSLINKATTPEGVAGQVSRLNTSMSDRPVFDLIYQVLAVAFDFAPVALVLFLLWEPTRSAFRRLGFDFARWRSDLKWVGILILAIGIPGLVFFGVSRLLGLNAGISTNGLADYWWTPLILIARALDAGVVEEVIVVGYLFTRLRELNWKPWAIILTSAALRGSYHLYQGYGAFVGNFVMGVVFGLLYQRYGRIMPLVIAHTIFDMIAFLGYPLALLWFPGVFA